MIKEKQLYDEGCPCNTCKHSRGYKKGCYASAFIGCDVLFDWFHPNVIKNPKCSGEK